MKKLQPFIIIGLIAVLIFIVDCANFNSPTAGNGNIALNIILSSDIDEFNGGKSLLPPTISTTDSVQCTISHSGSVVYDANLTFTGSQFSGTIAVDAGSNYLIEIDYYKDNILGYTGSLSGVDVIAGQTTPCTITLSPTQPQAPSSLTLAVLSSSRIDLTWNDNSINETGFKIERKTGSTGSYSQISTVGTDIEYYSDTPVDSNTEYYYRVLAYNTTGNSAYSNEAHAVAITFPAGYIQTFPLGNTGLNIEMVWIPPGSFMQGCGESGYYPEEVPQHLVTLNYGFWLGKYEITQVQWEATAGSWSFYFDNHPDYPAEMVSWNDITANFLPALNSQTSGSPWRLPSESEWEYACRAGTTTRFYWGDDPSYSQMGNYAWYFSNSGSTAHTVGTKLSNAWNLYDMIGNAYEWLEDYWHDSYTGAPDDGSAWLIPTSSNRLLRGAWWGALDYNCRTTLRNKYDPDTRECFTGFRIVSNP